MNTLLWALLGATTAFSILQSFSLLSLLIVALVIASLAYWLKSHPDKLRVKYETEEAKTALRTHNHKEWLQSPQMLRDMAPGIILLGVVCFYFAYTAAHGDSPPRAARIIYSAFGIPGIVFFWSFIGAYFLAMGVEATLGARVRK